MRARREVRERGEYVAARKRPISDTHRQRACGVGQAGQHVAKSTVETRVLPFVARCAPWKIAQPRAHTAMFLRRSILPHPPPAAAYDLPSVSPVARARRALLSNSSAAPPPRSPPLSAARRPRLAAQHARAPARAGGPPWQNATQLPASPRAWAPLRALWTTPRRRRTARGRRRRTHAAAFGTCRAGCAEAIGRDALCPLVAACRSAGAWRRTAAARRAPAPPSGGRGRGRRRSSARTSSTTARAASRRRRHLAPHQGGGRRRPRAAAGSREAVHLDVFRRGCDPLLHGGRAEEVLEQLFTFWRHAKFLVDFTNVVFPPGVPSSAGRFHPTER